jgi:hypothetical protein
MAKLYHPVTRATIEVPDKSVEVHKKSGWVEAEAAYSTAAAGVAEVAPDEAGESEEEE